MLETLAWLACALAALLLVRRAWRSRQRLLNQPALPDDFGRGRERLPPRRDGRYGEAQILCAVCEHTVDASTTTSSASGIVCPRCQPRAGAARISCNTCDAFVDPATTSSLEHYGIVCDQCRPRLIRIGTTEGGRVRCEVCDELVNAATTSTFEERNIVCTTCFDELEAGPNRNASFR